MNKRTWRYTHNNLNHRSYNYAESCHLKWQHTKFTCSYSPYKWGSRQPFRNQTTTTKPIAKCKQTDSGSGCKDFNTLKIVDVINTRQSLDRHHVGYGVTLRCTHSKQKCYSSVVTNTQQILATYKIYMLSVSYWTSVPKSTLVNCWQM